MFHIIDDEEAVRDVLIELLEFNRHAAIAFSSPIEYMKFVNSPE